MRAADAPLFTTRWSSDSPDDRFIVDNPATGAPLAQVCGAGPLQVDGAVRAAHAAQRRWRQRSAQERAGFLAKIADAVSAHAEEVARLETLENGKPLAQSREMDVTACIASFKFFSGLAEKLTPKDFASGGIDVSARLTPYGVVAGIIPFNWPPIHFAAKLAPALLAGNAVVLKPGEQAPLTVMRLAEIARDVLPDDVVHATPGGAASGQALIEHPLVRKVSFTGAPTTGRRILATLADKLTPALMELGGKNAAILFPDADLERAVIDMIDGAFFNKGEACTATSRILVHRSIYQEVVDRLSFIVRRLRTGDGLEATTDIGPLVSPAQRDRVENYIRIGQNEGAQIAAQGDRPTEIALKKVISSAPHCSAMSCRICALRRKRSSDLSPV